MVNHGYPWLRGGRGGWMGSSCHYCIHMASFPPTLPLHMQLLFFPTTIAMLHLSCSFRPTSPSFDDHVYSTNNFPACVLTRFPTTIVMLRLSCSMRPPSPHFVYHNCTTTTSAMLRLSWSTLPPSFLPLSCSNVCNNSSENQNTVLL